MTNETYLIKINSKNSTELYYKDKDGWCKVSMRGRRFKATPEQILNHVLPALAGVKPKVTIEVRALRYARTTAVAGNSWMKSISLAMFKQAAYWHKFVIGNRLNEDCRTWIALSDHTTLMKLLFDPGTDSIRPIRWPMHQTYTILHMSPHFSSSGPRVWSMYSSSVG